MKTIQAKVTEYFSTKQDVMAVYLYGSYASGNQTAKSDVDLGIILDPEKCNPSIFSEKGNQLMLELSRILRKEVHVVLLNYAGEGLLQQVLKRGELIYIHDNQKLNIFKARILQKIFDFNYYKRRMQAGFIRHVTAS